MTSAFDQRIVRVGLELESGTTVFEGLAIRAVGRKYTSPLQNECECRIFNLTRDQRNYVLTQASPLKQPRTLINMTLDVGRESYGTFRLFQGNVIAAETSQPPDIGITLRSLTSNYQTGVIAGYNQSSVQLLSVIAAAIASNNGLSLTFQAADKQIDNFIANGSALQQVNKLALAGGVDAYIDNGALVVLDGNKAKAGQSRLINAGSGMVGIPQVSESGVVVKMMIDNSIELGGSVTIESEMNPAANGTYKVVQIHFDLANRDAPFWYVLQCSNLIYAQGTS